MFLLGFLFDSDVEIVWFGVKAFMSNRNLCDDPAEAVVKFLCIFKSLNTDLPP